ncbi:ubiquinone biosynthesis protein COQ11 SCDLUD_000879 [Saccharomycodes ludwigii]|uniref:ubiquinone biosynthesis protein COQ11 n=1 Tax=Saccharomycodes ludwigii TaxID=36035 RepID=UPI001E882E5E|nr:hypothetical protein SCDLUD_000879 [Saccharomycodes ludwigii]KAH3903257.1 hypothetical protein SCDLUD_000879 [Saccharomycodes ludwigii]
MSMKSLLPTVMVFGGNGFLGSKIVTEFLNTNRYNVIVASRSLAGKQHSLSHSPFLQYKSVDIFNPATYKSILTNVDHVVHSIGIINPNENYKKIINSKTPCQFANGLMDYFFKSTTKNTSAVDKNVNQYELYNYQSCKILADVFKDVIKSSNTNTSTHKRSFTYISAEETPLVKNFISADYITTKRKAELHVLQYEDYFTPIILRPGFMYDENSTDTTPRSAIACILNNSNIIKNKSFTCSIQSVSKEVVRKIEDPKFQEGGIITLADIKRDFI